MKKYITAALLTAAAACGCAAQSVVKIDVVQNPLFEVSTHSVSLPFPDGTTSLTIGGDLVVKGGSGNYSYRWYDTAGTTLGTSKVLTVNNEGLYLLDIEDTCECVNTIQFAVGVSSVNTAITHQNISISPNPTPGPVEIAGFDAVQLSAVSMSGRVEAIINYDGAIIRQADLSHLSGGQYIIVLTDAEGNTTMSKLIKK